MNIKLFRNSSYLLGAQVVTKVVSFIYAIYLARNLGVESFGVLTIALSYFSIVSAIAELGINRYLIREIALDSKSISKLVCSVLLFRLTLVVVIFSFFAVTIYSLDQNSLRAAVILLAVAAILPQAISLTLDSVFVAMQKLKFSAIAMLVLSVANLFIGVFLVGSGFGVFGAASAMTLSYVVYSITLGILFALFIIGHKRIIKQLTDRRERSTSLQMLKKITTGSLPYGILGIIGLVYFKVDSILLGYLRGPYEAGIYGAAYKFLEAIIFIPTSVSMALFPILARLHEASLVDLRKLYWKSFWSMLIVSLVFSIAYVLILPTIIETLMPQYISSIKVLLILTLTIPFMFIHVPGTLVLLSSNKYLKTVIFLSFIPLTFNIIGNLLFIPEYGYMAAAWMTVFSEMLVFALFFIFLKKTVL